MGNAVLEEKAKVRPVLVGLSGNLVERLDSEAQRTQVLSRSAVIRAACQEYLDRRQRADADRPRP